MPVGSGRFRDHVQDPIGVLDMSFSSSFLIKTEGMYFCIHPLRIGQVLLHLTEMCSRTATLNVSCQLAI
jgi:hypothetical protein